MERETSQLLNKSNKNCKTWADAIKYQEKLPDAGRRYGIWGVGGRSIHQKQSIPHGTV